MSQRWSTRHRRQEVRTAHPFPLTPSIEAFVYERLVGNFLSEIVSHVAPPLSATARP